MKNLKSLSIFIMLLLAACSNNKQSADELVTVDVTKTPTSQKELILQDFMDVEYIPLETNDEFVNQGWVQAVGKKYILVTNYSRDGDIFIYDRTGKAIRKINRKGQGGEEYISCIDVTLDEDNNEMFINDPYAKKIQVYDLEGNFKRGFKQKDTGNSRFYCEIVNYDKENLLCYDELNDDVPFLIVSKQDGSITKEIKVPFKEKKIFIQLLRSEEGTRAAGPGEYNRITPFNGNLILLEPSCDTIYTLKSDLKLQPFIVRTPPVNSMNPETMLILRLLSNRYYFMEYVQNIYDFQKEKGFPRTYVVYDTQEKDFFKYIIYNGDYTYKKEMYMVGMIPINEGDEVLYSIQSAELRAAYESNKLKGQLKEVASKLNEEDNPVIMLIKQKQ